MGQPLIWNILNKHKSQRPISKFRGQHVAVDLSGWLFAAESKFKKESIDVEKPYLRVLYYKINRLLRSGLVPFVVADSPIVPDFKTKLYDSRKQKHYNSESKMIETKIANLKNKIFTTQIFDKLSIENFNNELKILKESKTDLLQKQQDLNEQILNEQNSNRTRKNSEKVSECKILLDNLGVQLVTSPDKIEAENYCSFLQKLKIVDYVISHDADCFTYGADKVISDFKTKSQSDYGYEFDKTSVNVCEIPSNLPKDFFIKASFLLGCEQYSGIPGYGQKTFVKNQHESIKNILKKWIIKDQNDRIKLQNDYNNLYNYFSQINQGWTSDIQNWTRQNTLTFDFNFEKSRDEISKLLNMDPDSVGKFLFILKVYRILFNDNLCKTIKFKNPFKITNITKRNGFEVCHTVWDFEYLDISETSLDSKLVISCNLLNENFKHVVEEYYQLKTKAKGSKKKS